MNQEYKCPCCGGAIEFDSSLQKMKCPYCDTEFDVSVFRDYDAHLNQDADDQTAWTHENAEWLDGDMTEYVCNSCGGSIMCDDNTAATSCPYCGNPVVMMGKVSGQLRPDVIIPFKLDKEKAKAGYAEHLKKKILLPKVFKEENHIDEIKGLYVPFWLFDADTDSRIRCKATKVRHWSDSRYDYTETSYFSVVRGGTLGFMGVPVDGSSAMPDDLMESVEPYDSQEETPFATAYFAGYLADKYDVNSQDSQARANDRIKSSVIDTLKSTVTGYSSVTVESSNVSYTQSACRYAMYPVWVMNTTWNGQKFLFAMNGQTGKFVGNLPCDRKKYWSLFAAFSIGIAALIFGIVLLFTAL